MSKFYKSHVSVASKYRAVTQKKTDTTTGLYDYNNDDDKIVRGIPINW